MAHLVEQFDGAMQNVEPGSDDKENAPLVHADVREILEADTKLRELGIDTVLIGSYKRQVSIRRMHDVDVFSKLTGADDSLNPSAVLTMFEKILVAKYGSRRVARQRRSLQVDFPDLDLYVDAVPARPVGARRAHAAAPCEKSPTGTFPPDTPSP